MQEMDCGGNDIQTAASPGIGWNTLRRVLKTGVLQAGRGSQCGAEREAHRSMLDLRGGSVNIYVKRVLR
jgi:hypothetical protein